MDWQVDSPLRRDCDTADRGNMGENWPIRPPENWPICPPSGRVTPLSAQPHGMESIMHAGVLAAGLISNVGSGHCGGEPKGKA